MFRKLAFKIHYFNEISSVTSESIKPPRHFLTSIQRLFAEPQTFISDELHLTVAGTHHNGQSMVYFGDVSLPNATLMLQSSHCAVVSLPSCSASLRLNRPLTSLRQGMKPKHSIITIKIFDNRSMETPYCYPPVVCNRFIRFTATCARFS